MVSLRAGRRRSNIIRMGCLFWPLYSGTISFYIFYNIFVVISLEFIPVALLEHSSGCSPLHAAQLTKDNEPHCTTYIECTRVATCLWNTTIELHQYIATRRRRRRRQPQRLLNSANGICRISLRIYIFVWRSNELCTYAHYISLSLVVAKEELEEEA